MRSAEAKTACGWIGATLVLALASSPALAQAPVLPPALLTPPPILQAPVPPSRAPAEKPSRDKQQDNTPRVAVSLNAVFAGDDIQAIGSGLKWRVFDARSNADGGYALIAESNEAAPTFQLADGAYIVHVACGLAGAAKPVAVSGSPVNERLVMNAGALKIGGQLGDVPIAPTRLNVMVYLPDRDDPEAKLIIPNLRVNEPECLPEGAYHIVSRLLDAAPGSTTSTNSTVYADLRVQPGKLTAGVLRHRAANMTLKLVEHAGGEALANTSFSILTPGGDVIREMIGAFPSLVLAEGEYVAIARHDNKTYQATFKVVSNQDRDVEVLTQQPAQ